MPVLVFFLQVLCFMAKHIWINLPNIKEKREKWYFYKQIKNKQKPRPKKQIKIKANLKNKTNKQTKLTNLFDVTVKLLSLGILKYGSSKWPNRVIRGSMILITYNLLIADKKPRASVGF